MVPILTVRFPLLCPPKKRNLVIKGKKNKQQIKAFSTVQGGVPFTVDPFKIFCHWIFFVTTGHKHYVALAHIPSAYWLYNWKPCFKVSGFMMHSVDTVIPVKHSETACICRVSICICAVRMTLLTDEIKVIMLFILAMTVPLFWSHLSMRRGNK